MKPLTVYMFKVGEKLHWRPHMQVLWNAFVGKIKEDQTVEIRIRIPREAKTIKQLGYLHAALYPCAVEAMREAGHDTLFDVSVEGFSTGVETNMITIDLFFKVLFKEFKSLGKLPEKEKMSIEEMSEYIEFILRWLAENLGVYAPPPREG